jgi:hypothetical protein
MPAESGKQNIPIPLNENVNFSFSPSLTGAGLATYAILLCHVVRKQ